MGPAAGARAGGAAPRLLRGELLRINRRAGGAVRAVAATEGAQRAAWRRYLVGTVAPAAEMIAAELAAKLEQPVALDVEALATPDAMSEHGAGGEQQSIRLRHATRRRHGRRRSAGAGRAVRRHVCYPIAMTQAEADRRLTAEYEAARTLADDATKTAERLTKRAAALQRALSLEPDDRRAVAERLPDLDLDLKQPFDVGSYIASLPEPEHPHEAARRAFERRTDP